jgi:hypothetical protein
MALLWIIETTAILVVVWTAAESIRRLYFHPLAHIPGPRLAALTWWYEFYFDAIQPGQYVFKIQQLHRQYGTLIPASLSSNQSNPSRPNHPCHAGRDSYKRCRLLGYGLRSINVSER